MELDSDLSDKKKLLFIQAVTVSVLLYGNIIWTRMKHLEKKLDGNSTRIQCFILNKSRKQHPTKQLKPSK